MFWIIVVTCIVIVPIIVILLIKTRLVKYKIPVNIKSVTFDEDCVIIKNKNKQFEYEQRIDKGFLKMRETKIIFTGLVHNLEHIVALTVHRLQHIGQFFNDYAIVIYENNSTDKTKDILAKLDENPRIHIISEDLQFVKSAVLYGSQNNRRFQLMAQYRNKCLQYIREMSDEYDVVGVVDMDLEGGISLEGVADSISYDTWDMIACNGRNRYNGLYYDMLAFKSIQGNRIKNFSGLESGLCIDRYKLRFEKGDSLVKVKSAFGGMAIYKTQVYLSSIYSGKDCEHVTYHEEMIKKGYSELFINPNFIVIA